MGHFPYGIQNGDPLSDPSFSSRHTKLGYLSGLHRLSPTHLNDESVCLQRVFGGFVHESEACRCMEELYSVPLFSMATPRSQRTASILDRGYWQQRKKQNQIYPIWVNPQSLQYSRCYAPFFIRSTPCQQRNTVFSSTER